MPTPKKIKCLLIDQDYEDVEIFKMAVEDLSDLVEVIAFADCASALKIIEEDGQMPNCIFLDSYLLRMNEHKCLEKIQKFETIAKTPIIVLASDPTLIKEEEFKDTSIAGIIYKENSIKEYNKSLTRFFASINA